MILSVVNHACKFRMLANVIGCGARAILAIDDCVP